MTRASNSAGYTLIEALGSLMLTGLLTLLLVIGVQAARHQFARLDHAHAGDEIEAAQTMLRARLERTYPLTVLLTPSAIIDFDGKGDDLAFTAPPPQSQGPGALERYHLYLSGGGQLMLDAISEVAADRDTPQGGAPLLAGVTSLDVAYFGSVGGQPPQWTSHWQQQPSLPRLVRVRLGFQPQDRRVWPTLIIKPAASLDSACVIDVNTGACQGRT